MHEKLAEYFAKQAENETNAQKQVCKEIAKRRKALLRSLGLCEVEKLEVEWHEHYDVCEEDGAGGKLYYKLKYGDVIPVTDEEFAQILDTLPAAAREQYEEDVRCIERGMTQVEPDREKEKQSAFAENFCMGLALFVWIAGGLVAVASGLLLESVQTFLIQATVYTLSGCLFLCGHYLFHYLRIVAEEVTEIRKKLK